MHFSEMILQCKTYTLRSGRLEAFIIHELELSSGVFLIKLLFWIRKVIVITKAFRRSTTGPPLEISI